MGLANAASFLTGGVLGCGVTAFLEQNGPSLSFLNSESLPARVGAFALHAICATAAIYAHYMIPQIGLSLLATRLLQGFLIVPLVDIGGHLPTASLNLDRSKRDDLSMRIFTLSLCAGFCLAPFSSIPLIATTGVIGLSSHLYTWYKQA